MQPHTTPAPSIVAILHENAANLGTNEAARTRASVADESVIAALEATVEAAAAAAHVPALSKEALDQRKTRLDEFKKDYETLSGDAGLTHADANALRKGVGTKPLYPAGVPLITRALLLSVIGLSIMFTMHDLFNGVQDPMLKWLFAGLSGLMIGAAIVFCLTPDDDPAPKADEPETFPWMFVFGITLAAGPAIIRFGLSRSVEDFAFSLGITAIELGPVFYLHYQLQAILAARRKWHRDITEWETLDRTAKIAEEEASLRKELAAKKGGEIQRFEEELERRTMENFDLLKVQESLRKTVRAHYVAEIEANRRRMRGVVTITPKEAA